MCKVILKKLQDCKAVAEQFTKAIEASAMDGEPIAVKRYRIAILVSDRHRFASVFYRVEDDNCWEIMDHDGKRCFYYKSLEDVAKTVEELTQTTPNLRVLNLIERDKEGL